MVKSERFELRLNPETIERLDRWRGEQSDLPSRAEAMRRLVELGLSLDRGSSESVAMSDAERLIISMLSDIMRKQKVTDGIDPDFISEVISGGHYWALKWEYTGLYHGYSDNYEDVKFVLDVLDMWDALERAHSKLSPKDKKKVKAEAEILGGHVKFEGFDGNNETGLMGIAYFLVEDMDRFQSFKGRDFNSHMPTSDAYERMLSIYKPLRQSLMGTDLSVEQIIEILNAYPLPKA